MPEPKNFFFLLKVLVTLCHILTSYHFQKHFHKKSDREKKLLSVSNKFVTKSYVLTSYKFITKSYNFTSNLSSCNQFVNLKF